MPLGISPELFVRYAVNTIPPSLVTLIPLAGDRSATDRDGVLKDTAPHKAESFKVIAQVKAKRQFEIVAKVK